ncbi:uncharacterized protein LOC142336175 [Convolutriloba macropyga]|uniref:uncharacterized protein LOC142336175 n=1 Tax=Convolutriloba macropyga TaxID=536237 RepID=UPI003F51D571
MVTPHVVFQDYFLRGRLMSIGTFMEAHYETLYIQRNARNDSMEWSYDYLLTDYRKARRTSATLWRIESPLRCLKLSFGFVNSILLIVMIKPFQDPVVASYKRIKEAFGRK